MGSRLGWVALLGALGCGTQPAPTAADLQPDKLGEKPGLHNLIRVNDWLYTGSEPEGDAGFGSLSQLGIRTIITVDGTAPDLKRAEAAGLRYVHIPIGYNAIPQERVLQLAKSMKELPKPIYLHCHHGKHRGPAAAMAGLRCLEPGCSASAALGFLKLAGTDPEYSELYASVESQRPLAHDQLDRVSPDFPATAPVPDLVGHMIEMDHILGKLKKGYRKEDAIALREQYREAARLSNSRPEAFRDFLRQGETHADELVRDAKLGISASEATCVQCHKAYRNHAGR